MSYARTVYINVNGGQQRSWQIAENATPSGSYTANFSSLQANTTYQARCVVYRNSDWTEVYSETDSFTTDMPKLSPPTLNVDATIKTNSTLQITMYAVMEANYYHARINSGSIQTKNNTYF